MKVDASTVYILSRLFWRPRKTWCTKAGVWRTNQECWGATFYQVEVCTVATVTDIQQQQRNNGRTPGHRDTGSIRLMPRKYFIEKSDHLQTSNKIFLQYRYFGDSLNYWLGTFSKFQQTFWLSPFPALPFGFYWIISTFLHLLHSLSLSSVTPIGCSANLGLER